MLTLLVSLACLKEQSVELISKPPVKLPVMSNHHQKGKIKIVLLIKRSTKIGTVHVDTDKNMKTHIYGS